MIYQKIEQSLHQQNWNKEPHNLYAPIAYTLESGGKRMRPAMALIACQMFDGNLQEAMPAAMALEIFHNFTLLHDDVMDNADERRGRPTVHRKWNTNTAILSGDQMLIEAYKLISQVPQDYALKCLALFSDMATEICEGQQYDMDFEIRNDVTLDEYLLMIQKKTAVLLGTSLQMGAMIAGASEFIQATIYHIGINMGIAFQLRDDYLDTFGNAATFGKKIGGDIIEKKKTYLYINAYLKANEQQKKELDKWFAAEQADEKIANITRLYKEIGVDQLCLEAIEHYNQEARRLLEKFRAENKQALYDILNKLETRNS